MAPRRREVDWLALLEERTGSEEEARRVEADPALARRLESMRELVTELRQYRREHPLTADDLIDAAEGRAGSAVQAQIDADSELTSLVEAARSIASEPLDEDTIEPPPLPDAVRARLAEAPQERSSTAGDRLALTLRALGHSAANAARRAAEIVSLPDAAAPAPAASDDLTRVEEEAREKGSPGVDSEAKSKPGRGED